MAHSLGECFYILTKSGLTLKHRTYAINQTDEDLLEWEGINLKEKVPGTLAVEKEGEEKYIENNRVGAFQ